MTKVRTFPVPEPGADADTAGDQRRDDTLAAAIRKPVDALNAAAEEAAKGMLGGAKLGLLVAANLLRDALEAIDAEFARRSATHSPGDPERKESRSPSGLTVRRHA